METIPIIFITVAISFASLLPIIALMAETYYEGGVGQTVLLGFITLINLINAVWILIHIGSYH